MQVVMVAQAVDPVWIGDHSEHGEQHV